jgi:hypothetical protein
VRVRLAIPTFLCSGHESIESEMAVWTECGSCVPRPLLSYDNATIRIEPRATPLPQHETLDAIATAIKFNWDFRNQQIAKVAVLTDFSGSAATPAA